MTLKEILKLNSHDIAAMKMPELRSITQTMRNAAYKRVKALKELEVTTGFKSPALREFEKRKGFKSKRKTLNNLRHDFMHLFKFLNSKTSTIKGFKDYYKKTSAKFEAASQKTNRTIPELLTLFGHWSNKYKEEFERVPSDIIVMIFSTVVAKYGDKATEQQILDESYLFVKEWDKGFYQDIADDFFTVSDEEWAELWEDNF